MKAGNLTGISEMPNQDMAMWLTIGPVADKTQDRLGASDLAIVEFRKLMVQAVKDFQQGAPAIGAGDQHILENVCSRQNVIPQTSNRREYEAHYIWNDNSVNPELDTAYSVSK